MIEIDDIVVLVACVCACLDIEPPKKKNEEKKRSKNENRKKKNEEKREEMFKIKFFRMNKQGVRCSCWGYRA